MERPGLFPESVVYDAERERFLVGSFREGNVYEVLAHGEVRRVVEDSRLISILGIAIDPSRRRVLVASSDLGAGRRSSASGPRTVAAFGSYSLTDGSPAHYVDLGALLPDRPHLANGVTIDPSGNAYVTDSFASAVYRIAPDGRAQVLVESHEFDGNGVGLNGIAFHADGFLLVVKKSDGNLYRIPLADPASFAAVRLPRPLRAADGVLVVTPSQLVVVSNEANGVSANEVVELESQDGWQSATISDIRHFGPVYPTAAVVAGETLFVLHSELNRLLTGSTSERNGLRNVATLEAVGRVNPLRLFDMDGER